LFDLSFELVSFPFDGRKCLTEGELLGCFSRIELGL